MIKKSYTQIFPSKGLENYLEVFWEHKNNSESSNNVTIFPDSFFKLIINLVDGKVVNYYLTGMWTKEVEIAIPPKTTIYGIKFKILAPEYIFQEEIASLLDSHKDLNTDFFNLKDIHFDSFEHVVEQLETEINSRLSNSRKVENKKLQLTQLLDKVQGDISVEEVSNQINWGNRQISRYLNKYIGLSLKTYLNIQKCYTSYIQIREGRFFPEKGYYDQAHFIKEVKKHTNNTPKELHAKQNDQFIQLKNIKKK